MKYLIDTHILVNPSCNTTKILVNFEGIVLPDPAYLVPVDFLDSFVDGFAKNQNLIIYSS